MKFTVKSVVTLLLIICSTSAIAVDSAGSEVTIDGTERRSFSSEIVGQEYRLLISLPAGYGDSDQRFPVVYLLDAQWDFPLVYSVYGEQYYDGFIPGLIIVGLTWGGENPNADILRVRDFTPTDASGNGEGGGAAKFLLFFEQELIPYVDQTYRTTENRTLIGSSLGGLFTLYTLFQRPDLFDNYIATSPATPWDNDVLYGFEKGFSKRSASSPSRLFIAVSELEDLYRPVNKLIERLRLSNYPGLSWTSHVVTGAGHSGVKPEGNSRGLQYVFKRPDLALTEEELQPYLGGYLSEDGATEALVKIKDGKLQASVSTGGESWIMNAQDKTHFYHNGSFLKVKFELDDSGQATGFVVRTYGNSQEFSRLGH